jgi:hypothetical protein
LGSSGGIIAIGHSRRRRPAWWIPAVKARSGLADRASFNGLTYVIYPIVFYAQAFFDATTPYAGIFTEYKQMPLQDLFFQSI